MEIKRESIKYSAKRKRERNKTEEILQKEIENLEIDINEKNGNVERTLENLKIKQNMLQDMRKDK